METNIEHVQSFINVLHARQQFLKAQYNNNESLRRSTGPDVALDITRNSDDYNKNIAEFLTELKNQQLQTNIMDKAVETAVMQLNLNLDPRQKMVMDLMNQFAIATMEEKQVKCDLINLKREVIYKHRSSVHDIDKLLKVLELKVEEQQRDINKLKNVANKVKKMNVVHDLMNHFLSEIDQENLFSDPQLLKFLKKYRKAPLFQLEY